MIILNNVTLIADHCNLEKLSKECCPYENGIEIIIIHYLHITLTTQTHSHFNVTVNNPIS